MNSGYRFNTSIENHLPIRKLKMISVMLFLSLVFQTTLFAQEVVESQSLLKSEAPTLRFEHLKIENGLAQGSANSIMQDSQGYIWITTQGGLHRYDGHEFKVYASTPFDTTSLSDSWTWAVAEDENGDLWVTTEGGGLNKMDRATGTFISYRNDPDDSTSISSDRLFHPFVSSTGDLWVSTSGDGLNRMKAGEDGIFKRYYHDHENENSLTDNAIIWISEDEEGNIWAGSANGINRIDPNTDTITRFLYDPEENGIFYGAAQNVLSQYIPPNDPGYIWLATGNGLVKMDVETGSYDRFLIAPNEKETTNPLNLIHEVAPDPDIPGVFWVAGPGTGVARFDVQTEEFTSYRHDQEDANSLAENYATSLFADRSGTLWVGYATEGISKFNPGAVNFVHIKHDPDDPTSIAPGIVWGVYEDRNGTLWVGSQTGPNEDYLTQFNTKSEAGAVNRFMFDSNDSTSILPGSIRVFAEDNLGQFWVGTSIGLSLLDRETGLFTRHVNLPYQEKRRRNVLFRMKPTIDDPNILWVASIGGVDRFDAVSKTYTPVSLITDNITEEPAVLTIYEDDSRTLWVASFEGLMKVSPSGEATLVSSYNPIDTTSISNNIVMEILERSSEPGILWLATQSAGLDRFDTKTGKATHYTTEDGLPSNYLYSVLEDNNGTLWMSTNNGISNFDPETETFRNYGLDDGLMMLEYDQNAYFKGAGGIMYFGSGKGVTAFIPEQLHINETPPQVVLSDFKLFNKSVKVGPDSPLKKALSKTESITLNYSQNEITFEYVALHFTNSVNNKYSYQLMGFDKEWVQADNQRSATYTNLAPGDYIFKVKGANSDGIWNENYTSVNLKVLPPWYRTWWAYGFFAGVLGFLAFGVDRTQRRRISKKETERTALREAELRAEAENKRRADTEQLSMIGRAITSSLSVNKIIDTVYENVNALMDAAIFGVGIYNKELKSLDFPATKEKGVMLPALSYQLTEKDRLAVICFNKKEEIIISDFEKEHKKFVSEYKAPLEGEVSSSVIYLPLIYQSKIIGVITTQSFEKNAYSEYHINLLRNLATYAAIALDNASAYRKLNSTLSELKTMQEQLVQQEKLASLGQLTAGIAHEIKNPLNFVTNFSDLNVELLEEARDLAGNNEDLNEILDDIEANLKKIHEHGSRADRIVKSMLQHSRGGSGQKTPTNLNGLVKEYVNLAFHGMRASKNAINVNLEFDLDETISEISLIVEDFSRVIVNLCNNAFDAMREKIKTAPDDYKPRLTIRTKFTEGKVSLEIEDNGPGIPSELKGKIMQPFFTTKKGKEGTGLGLSITNDIIKAHGGKLEIESKENQYTLFRVYTT